MYLCTRHVSRAASPKPPEDEHQTMKRMGPAREQVSAAVFHCGAGCTIGDIIGEAGLFAVGGASMTVIGGSEFATKLVVDFVLAYALGIFFQYFTIAPMRSISGIRRIVALSFSPSEPS